MAHTGSVLTSLLDIAYEHSGPIDALPVVLMHGFPYDPRCFDAVVPIINAAGHRTIVPYLRGYGGTRFLSPDTMRSGQQAAIGHDLLELLDALDLQRVVLAGYDWGGRAACVVSALWPERVLGLVTACGYAIQDVGARQSRSPPSKSIDSGTSITSRPGAGAPGSPPIAPIYAACYGSFGRRPGPSMTRAMPGPRRRSTTRISSTWSSTRIGIAWATSNPTRAMPQPKPAWPPCRGSTCRPSQSTAPTMASTPCAVRSGMRNSSPIVMSAASLKAPATTRRKSRRRPSPMPYWRFADRPIDCCRIRDSHRKHIVVPAHDQSRGQAPAGTQSCAREISGFRPSPE